MSGKSHDREGDLEQYRETYPVDALNALVLVQDLPNSAAKSKMATNIKETIQTHHLAELGARLMNDNERSEQKKQILEVFATHPSIAFDLLSDATDKIDRLWLKVCHLENQARSEKRK